MECRQNTHTHLNNRPVKLNEGKEATGVGVSEQEQERHGQRRERRDMDRGGREGEPSKQHL